MKKKILYVGLDVHKKSIDVAITDQGVSGKVRSYGKIDGTLEALDKLVGKLKSPGADLHFVYEAGSCGYPIYRHLSSKGCKCSVVVPSLVPKRNRSRLDL
jgi:transposase